MTLEPHLTGDQRYVNYYFLFIKTQTLCESQSLSRVRLFVTSWIYSPWNSPGQNTGVGTHSLLQGIFPGIDPSFSHCRQILYQPNHQGSPDSPC